MSDKSASDHQQKFGSFPAKAAVILVRLFGSWTSVIVHTLIFIGWFTFDWGIETLLVIVSIEAIYIGIFILMAENIETAQKELKQKIERQKEMSVVKRDVAIDTKTLQTIQELHHKIDDIHKLVKK